MTKKKKQQKPTHKECRQCGRWFELPRYSRPTRRFCSVSCSAIYHTSQPKWKKAQSAKIKAWITQMGPEAMREIARSAWRDPETRAVLSAKIKKRTNGKEHLAWMAEHNKRLWSDKDFRKRHSASSSQRFRKKWRDPVYREKMSALATELNKKRWADPAFRERTSRNIRIAKLAPLEQRRQAKQNREMAQRPESRERSRKEMKSRWDNPQKRAEMTKRNRDTATRKWRDDPAYRMKHIAVLVAAARSPENRALVSRLNKERWADPEYAAQMKAWWTPERKAAQIEANKKRWSDPEFKARVGRNISAAKKGKTPKRASDPRSRSVPTLLSDPPMRSEP